MVEMECLANVSGILLRDKLHKDLLMRSEEIWSREIIKLRMRILRKL